ncbi:hypothetical protein C4J92_0698 [Pseudomonas sp. R3-18-08]|nr:hypothetical protein C4J92_0698 [Pseudomonas sp. R3-18-08]
MVNCSVSGLPGSGGAVREALGIYIQQWPLKKTRDLVRVSRLNQA